MAAGASVGEHPAQPRASIFKPFLRATRRAVQPENAFIDLAVIKTLLHVTLAEDPCMLQTSVR